MGTELELEPIGVASKELISEEGVAAMRHNEVTRIFVDPRIDPQTGDVFGPILHPLTHTLTRGGVATALPRAARHGGCIGARRIGLRGSGTTHAFACGSGSGFGSD